MKNIFTDSRGLIQNYDWSKFASYEFTPVIINSYLRPLFTMIQ